MKKQLKSQEFIHPLILSPTPTCLRKKIEKSQKNRVCFPSCSSWNLKKLLFNQTDFNCQRSVGVFYLLLKIPTYAQAEEFVDFRLLPVVGWNRQARLIKTQG